MTIIEKDTEKDELTITLRGETDKVIEAMIHGLPRESLQQLHDQLQIELKKRDR